VTVRFETATSVAAPPEVVFDLALSIDVHLDSQAGANERAVAGVTTGLIGLGEEVTWRATHFHIPFTMTSRVTEFDRPIRFVDEQTRGPFRRFRHEHVFRRSGEGTDMIDRLQFDAPLGPIGRLVERVLLASYLRRLIDERGHFIKVAAERQSP
jgi:ligand-binding SRPBCC domain-containing protein